MKKRNILKTILPVALLVLLGSACQRSSGIGTGKEVPDIGPKPERGTTVTYPETVSQKGEIPEHLVAVGSLTVYPYMTLDYAALQKGEIVEVGNNGQYEGKLSYLFGFRPVPVSISVAGTPGLKQYAGAQTKAFSTEEYAKRSADNQFEYYRYGFSETDRTTFVAEYYSCNFSVTTGTKYLVPENHCYVSSVYWGKYARLTIKSNLPAEFVYKAYKEREAGIDSEAWKKVDKSSSSEIIVRPALGNQVKGSSELFFSTLKSTAADCVPIFFTVSRSAPKGL